MPFIAHGNIHKETEAEKEKEKEKIFTMISQGLVIPVKSWH